MSFSSLINNKFVKFSLAILVGIVCLYYVISNFNWSQIWESLQKADLVRFFSGALTTLLAFFFFRAARWYLLLRSENLNVPFVKLYLYNTVSIGISNVTPFQSGEAVKVEFLRKHGGGRLTGYTIFFLERVFDLLTVVGMAVLGISFGFNLGISPAYFYIFAIVFIAGFAAAVGTLFLISSERLNPIKILLLEKWKQKRVLLLSALFTVCSWSVAALGWKITLSSVSIDISFLQSVTLVSLTMLLAIISFVPGAAGVSEIGITTILTEMGVEPSLAQTGAIALRAYALMLLLLALFHWIISKVFSTKLSANVD